MSRFFRTPFGSALVGGTEGAQDVLQETNAVLLEKMTTGLPGGTLFSYITIFSEGALLVVAAQAGFMDGPRVLSTMAVDSWMPRRFASSYTHRVSSGQASRP